jgi:uncharacterized integral membrane protein
MAEEQRPDDGGNGGPVTPGGEPHGGHGNGSNGNGTNGNGNGHAGPGAHGGRGGDATTVIKPEAPPVGLRGGRVSGAWVALTLSAVVLIFLLVFIVQNNVSVPIKFLGAEGTLPLGVALLFAAALGILLVAIPGYGRILQLRRALRKRGPR